MKRTVPLVAAGLVLVSCGGPPPAPPPPPPLDPTGTYSIAIDARQMQVDGVLTIRKTDSGYSGFVDTDMGGAAISRVTVDGNRVTFDVPEGGVSFDLAFENGGFTGSFEGAMGAGTIRGTRRPSG